MLPHTPHNPPQRLYEKYVRDDRTESEVLYLAMCEWYDENVGELLALLDETGERDNTLIVFVVDNGFVPLKDHPGVLDPRSKTSPYNAGVRTPILLNWPGRIRPARYDIPVHTIDLVPTTLAAAGIEIPEELPGKNLLEVCQGKDLNRSTLFGANFRRRVPSPKLPTDTMDYRWCLSWPWKLILPRDGQSPELYDISSDPHETVNLAEDHSAIVADLTRQLDDWWDVSEAVSINN